MSGETEQVYRSREVATLLGLGSAMLRRYAVAYEQATGKQLELDRRDGRVFSERDLAVLSQARQLVATQGVPVDTAIKTALAQPESAPKPLALLPAANGDALAAVLTQAITEAQKPLLGELQSVNRELQAVRLELTEMRADNMGLPERVESRPKKEGDELQHGLFVRAAMWVEKKLRRGRE